MGIIATPLGWIMKGCYFVCKNYGIALLLFTILTRLIVFPLNVKQQKSMARMTMLQPELEKIKKKYAKNQQKMQEEQMNLYAKAGVNPMASCLPMVITMVILFALIPVIYGPLTYVSNADKEELTDSNNMISNLYVVSAEVKSKDTTIEKLIEKFEKDGATEDEAYDKLEKLLTDKDKYPKSAKALSNDNKISNVMDAIKAYVAFYNLRHFRACGKASALCEKICYADLWADSGHVRRRTLCGSTFALYVCGCHKRKWAA